MAVYTDIPDDELEHFISTNYAIGTVVSCIGIAEGVENSNFMLQTDQGPYILTLYEKRVNPDDLPFFIDLMRHLSAKGLSCPVPIAGVDGAPLREIAGRPACIISFLKGQWPRKIHPYHCFEVGKALANMHVAGMDFPHSRANTLNLASWRPLFQSCAAQAHDILPRLAIDFDAELAFLDENWPSALPTGIIHADLFPDNVFFMQDECSGLIDFYFACEDQFAYDLAICMNAWCFEYDGAFNTTKARQLLSGYCKNRSLSSEELKALPILCRGAAMRFLLTRLYDWINTPKDAFVKPKDPAEYAQKLRFHQGIKSASAYGFARS
jgi:homoserine kinase type II